MLKATPKFVLQVSAGMEEYRLSMALANGKPYEAIPLMREIDLAGKLSDIVIASECVTKTELQRRAVEALVRWYTLLPKPSQSQIGQFMIPARLRRRKRPPVDVEQNSAGTTKTILAATAEKRRRIRPAIAVRTPSDGVLQLEDLVHDRSRKKPKR